MHEAGRLDSDLFLFFEKALYEVKSGGKHLSLQAILTAFDLAYSKSKLNGTLDY